MPLQGTRWPYDYQHEVTLFSMFVKCAADFLYDEFDKTDFSRHL